MKRAVMTRFRTAAFLGALLACTAMPAAALTAQQQKMKDCSAEATQKSLTSDARKAFMKTCLSAGAANSQQAKMKICDRQANDQHLTGDARKQ